MSALDSLKDLMRPSRLIDASTDGPPKTAVVEAPEEAPSRAPVESGYPAVAEGSATEAPPAQPPAGPSSTVGEDSGPDEELNEPTNREKSLMLHLSNVSHGVNHFQNQMLTMLYPYIMAELGMSYMQVGVLSAVRSVITAISQGTYGFITPLMSRCKILGFANFVLGLGTLLSGIALTYPMLVFSRCVAALGSSAQHPVGYSILSSYFPKTRGSVLAINTSASNVGTLIATPVATALLIILGWREIFFIVAIASIAMGAVYLLFRDYGAPDRSGSGSRRLGRGFRSYWRVLNNRNMILIALVFMVGAAGAEGGIQQTYFAPHLANDFGYSALMVGILITAMNIGAIGGPILFGWLSDRLSRIGVLQASLFLSAIGTLWIAWMGPGEIALFIGLMVYSAVTHSRGTLTQAIVADLATDEDRDAAFSLYFFLGFLAQPVWLLVTGLLMDQQGWGVAVSRLAVSYLVGCVLLFFVRGLGTPAKAAAA